MLWEDYKYLEILEANIIKQRDIKIKKWKKSTSEERGIFLKPKSAADISSKK